MADLVVGALAVVAGLGVGALPDQVVCCATVVAPHATHPSSKPKERYNDVHKITSQVFPVSLSNHTNL